MFNLNKVYLEGQVIHGRKMFEEPEDALRMGVSIMLCLTAFCAVVTFCFLLPDLSENPWVHITGQYDLFIGMEYFPCNFAGGFIIQFSQACYWTSIWQFVRRAVDAVEMKKCSMAVLYFVRFAGFAFAIGSSLTIVSIMTPDKLTDEGGLYNIMLKKRTYQISIGSSALWFLAQWLFAASAIKVHSFHFWRFTVATLVYIACTIRKLILIERGLAQVAAYAQDTHVKVQPERFFLTDTVWATAMIVFTWYHILDGWDAIAPGGDSERGPSATLQNAHWDVAPYVKVPEEDEELNAKLADAIAHEFERGVDIKHKKCSEGNEDWGNTLGHVRGVFEIDDRIKFLHPDLRVGFFEKPGKYEAIIRVNATTKTEARMSVRVMLPPDTPESKLLLNNMPTTARANEENVPLRANGSGGAAPEPIADFLFAEDLKEFFGMSCEAMTALLQAQNKPPEWGNGRLVCHALWWINTFLKMAGLRDKQEDRTIVEGYLPRTGVWGKKFYGGLPFRMGPGGCKWSLLPRQRNRIGRGPHRSVVEAKDDLESYKKSMKLAEQRYIGEAEHYLQDKDAVFDFSVQVATDPEFHDFKKAEAIWAEDLSPYFGVGTLTIPMGQKMQKCAKEGLMFSVWNNLKEHRPIGPVNNARAEVYKRHGAARAKIYGQCPVTRVFGV